MTRLTTDVDALNEMFTAGVIVIFGDLAMIFYIVIWMFQVNWKLALVSFAILPLLAVLTTWFRLGARSSFRQVRLRIARINAFLQEHITGMPVVQLFNREDREMRQFNQINDAHRKANIDTIYYYAIFYPAVEILGSIGMGLIIWYGGGQVLRNAVTIGTLVAFIQLARSFYEPISDISEKYNILQSAMASSERIFKLLDEPVAIASPASPVHIGRARGEIEFRNVWFAYKDEDWILKDVSFSVRPGERVAFVGHTGAGKTTITNLLPPILRCSARTDPAGRCGCSRTGPRRAEVELQHRAPGTCFCSQATSPAISALDQSTSAMSGCSKRRAKFTQTPSSSDCPRDIRPNCGNAARVCQLGKSSSSASLARWRSIQEF
jgi:ATP-binding cassette subfamily B protein